ncbi:MAG: beta-lactamase family protein [Anaerolineales bacterium]|jgi:CubicO group peptidase (beta-lactamase class C family)|nr:beta-lactamase family protein [Anaerolineales bacterium]
MNQTTKLILRIILWGAVIFLVLFVAVNGYFSLRYSPEYVYRELFMDLGTVYDYRVLPERKLTASSHPFQFSVDPSQEARVESAFQSNPNVGNLESFLAETRTQAFLVIQDDTILYERYFLGVQRDSLVTSYSVAKSFDSALIGIAIQEGYIQSVDEPITNYIPELAERDPRFQEIQIRHLLMMGSGLRYDTRRWSSSGDDNLTYEFNDLRHLALTETEVVEQPGLTFVYNNYNPLLLGMILERATGRPVSTYLQEKLWTPLGMQYDGSWSLDSEKSGFEKMESGINARAIDFAKFGRLYLNGGVWDGAQIVPADWVAVSTRDNGLILDAPIYYGYMWWGEKCNPDSQDFFALGNFGQFIYISPAKNLIVVRNAESYGIENEVEAWGDIFCQFAKALP